MPDTICQDPPEPPAAGGDVWARGDVERAAFQSAANILFILAPDGTIRRWNSAAAERFGYAPEEAIGQSVDIIVPEIYRDEVHAILTRVVREGRAERYDAVRRHKSGRVVTVSFAMSPIPDDAGVIVGALVVGFGMVDGDVADTTFRVAVEASPSGLILIDRFGIVLMVNSEMERLFGYRREELIGHPVEVLLPESLREIHMVERASYTRDPSHRAMGAGRDLNGRRKDGSLFPVEVGLNPSHSPAGRFIVATVVDITHRKRQEDQMRVQAEELQRSNADLEQFAYVASHDLQEPLRMVASYTQLLADRYKGHLDERADKYLAYALEGAQRMQSLVRDLLAYSRLSAIDKAKRHPIDSGAIVRQVIAGLARQIEDAGIAVTVGPLPVVISSEAELQSVFLNLISNAIKFRGAELPTIRISAEMNGDFWRFLIQDNGIGIDERYYDRVFQMFQRLYERGKYEGNGIGLAIVKKIVEQHGGAIWVDSRPGCGSSFHFTLPRTREAAR